MRFFTVNKNFNMIQSKTITLAIVPFELTKGVEMGLVDEFCMRTLFCN